MPYHSVFDEEGSGIPIKFEVIASFFLCMDFLPDHQMICAKLMIRKYNYTTFGNNQHLESHALHRDLYVVYMAWTYLHRRTKPPLSRILLYLSNICAATAKGINRDRGEWGVVIREPQQAKYAPTLVGLPAEMTDTIVASCEPVLRNASPFPGADYSIVDRLHRDGERRAFSGPSMIGLAQTNRQLRCCFMMHMFRGKVLHVSHGNVERTVDFFAGLYPSTRNGIRGLHIE